MNKFILTIALLAFTIFIQAQNIGFSIDLNGTESTSSSYVYDITATNNGGASENIALYQIKIYFETAEVANPAYTKDPDGTLGWDTSFDTSPDILAASNPAVPTDHDMSIEISATDANFAGTDLASGASAVVGRLAFDAMPGAIDATSAIYFGTNPETDAALLYNDNSFVTSYPITNAQPQQALPVEISSFEVTKRGEKSAELVWVTQSEQNASHFEIERSYTGADFEYVGSVEAMGESKETVSYDYIDRTIELNTNQNTIVYYRLKVMDNDGSFEYTDVKNISFETEDVEVVVHPNPTADYVVLNSDAAITGVSIFDIDGKLLVDNLPYEGKVDFTSLNSGMYNVMIHTENGNFLKSIVKID
jgi:hypothetical protein